MVAGGTEASVMPIGVSGFIARYWFQIVIMVYKIKIQRFLEHILLLNEEY